MIEKYYLVSSLFDQRHSIAAENLPIETGIETLRMLDLSLPSDYCNMRMSAARVDIDVSKHNVVKFFTKTDDSVIVIWSCSSEEYDEQHRECIQRKLEEALLSKEDGSTPKNLWYDCAEFAWVSYDIVDQCIFINHNQINGVFKGEMRTNEEISWYRYALSSLIEMLPVRCQIYGPTSSLYNEMSNDQINANITSRPYSREVMINAGFIRMPLEEMLQNPSVAAVWNGPKTGVVWKYNRQNAGASSSGQ